MTIRLLDVVCLAALVVFPAHGQFLPRPTDHVVAITTYGEYITEEDIDQRTRLDLFLAEKKASREDVINQLSIDLFDVAKAKAAGLLSDALVDQAFADMCSRRGIAPDDLTNALAKEGIGLDTLRKSLRSDLARERLARMPNRDYEDRLDHPSFPSV